MKKASFYSWRDWDSEKINIFLKVPQLVSNQWGENLNLAGLIPEPTLLITYYIAPSIRILSRLNTLTYIVFTDIYIRYMTTPQRRNKEDHQKLACIQCKRLSSKHTRIKEAVSLYGNGSQPKVILPIGDIWQHLGKKNYWQLVARGWEYYSVSHNGPEQPTTTKNCLVLFWDTTWCKLSKKTWASYLVYKCLIKNSKPLSTWLMESLGFCTCNLNLTLNVRVHPLPQIRMLET